MIIKNAVHNSAKLPPLSRFTRNTQGNPYQQHRLKRSYYSEGCYHWQVPPSEARSCPYNFTIISWALRRNVSQNIASNEVVGTGGRCLYPLLRIVLG